MQLQSLAFLSSYKLPSFVQITVPLRLGNTNADFPEVHPTASRSSVIGKSCTIKVILAMPPSVPSGNRFWGFFIPGTSLSHFMAWKFR